MWVRIGGSDDEPVFGWSSGSTVDTVNYWDDTKGWVTETITSRFGHEISRDISYQFIDNEGNLVTRTSSDIWMYNKDSGNFEWVADSQTDTFMYWDDVRGWVTDTTTTDLRLGRNTRHSVSYQFIDTEGRLVTKTITDILLRTGGTDENPILTWEHDSTVETYNIWSEENGWITHSNEYGWIQTLDEDGNIIGKEFGFVGSSESYQFFENGVLKNYTENWNNIGTRIGHSISYQYWKDNEGFVTRTDSWNAKGKSQGHNESYQYIKEGIVYTRTDTWNKDNDRTGFSESHQFVENGVLKTRTENYDKDNDFDGYTDTFNIYHENGGIMELSIDYDKDREFKMERLVGTNRFGASILMAFSETQNTIYNFETGFVLATENTQQESEIFRPTYTYHADGSIKETQQYKYKDDEVRDSKDKEFDEREQYSITSPLLYSGGGGGGWRDPGLVWVDKGNGVWELVRKDNPDEVVDAHQDTGDGPIQRSDLVNTFHSSYAYHWTAAEVGDFIYRQTGGDLDAARRMYNWAADQGCFVPWVETQDGKLVNLDAAGDFITKNGGSRSLRDEVVETMGNLINSGGTLTEFEVTDTNMEIEVVGGTVGSGEQMNYSAQGSVDGEGSVITTRTELPQHGYSVEDVYVNGDLFAVISYEVDTLGNTAVTKMEGEFDANKNLINGTVTTADNSRLIVRNGIAVAKIDVQGNEFVRGDQGQWELFNGTREEENGSVVIVLNGQDIAKEDGQGNQWVMGGDGQWKILNGTVDGKTYENGELVSVEGGFAGGKPMFKILPAGGGYMTPGEGDIPPEQAGYVVFLPETGGETPENASGGIILPMILKDGDGSSGVAPEIELFLFVSKLPGGTREIPVYDFSKITGVNNGEVATMDDISRLFAFLKEQNVGDLEAYRVVLMSMGYGNPDNQDVPIYALTQGKGVVESINKTLGLGILDDIESENTGFTAVHAPIPLLIKNMDDHIIIAVRKPDGSMAMFDFAHTLVCINQAFDVDYDETSGETSYSLRNIAETASMAYGGGHVNDHFQASEGRLPIFPFDRGKYNIEDFNGDQLGLLWAITMATDGKNLMDPAEYIDQFKNNTGFWVREPDFLHPPSP